MTDWTYWTKDVELHDVGTHPGDTAHPQPIDPKDVTQCGTCLRKWCHVCNPTPAARCPFEYDHDDDTQECSRCGDMVYTLSTDDLCDGCVAEDAAGVTDSQRLTHAKLKVTHWLASLEANKAHAASEATQVAIQSRIHDMQAVLAILDGSDDDYIRATGGVR